MIDTSKRFLSAHWPKILSILAVAVFVIGITFSCGLVSSKAYESFPSGYMPVMFELSTEGWSSTYCFDVNELPQDLYEDRSFYTLCFDQDSAMDVPVSLNGSVFATTIPCPVQTPRTSMRSYKLHLTGSDLTPMFTSSSTSYDISYSPYEYVNLAVLTPNADDELAYIDVVVDYVTYTDSIDPQTGMYVTNSNYFYFQYTPPLAYDRSYVSVAEIIRDNLPTLPANTSIEAVHLDFTHLYQATELIDPDEHPNEQISIVLELSAMPSDISRSNFQLLRQRLNTLYGLTGDGSDGSYQQGYNTGFAEGKNVGLTQNLGITRWLTDAGDSVLGMRIFQVHTPHFVDGQYQPLLVDVTLGNILGVFLGGFLLIFILKMFAGG